jgi:glycolate oxidase subunit GlcD
MSVQQFQRHFRQDTLAGAGTPLEPEILQQFSEIVGEENLLSDPIQAMIYECDAFPFHRHTPDAVVLVSCRDEVVRAVQLARKHHIPFVPRGSGTGLSGGALPRFGGVVITLTRMKTIREIDCHDRQVVAGPGVINADLSRMTERQGFYFAPDPSSQTISTIGGNLAENAGGPHCLKYGMTANHVISLEVVLPSGAVVELGSRAADCPGYDLVGVFVGSEGTFGIATEAVLRLTPLPQAVKTLLAAFPTIKDACDAVTSIIARGIIPAALEMMDRRCILAVEASVNRAGLPTDAEAVLIIELDGLSSALEPQAASVLEICRGHHAGELRLAAGEDERQAIWKGRKHAFGAAGRMTRDLYLQDAVVPRNRLSEVVVKLYEIADRMGFPLASLIHAGDGNLHPILLFDRGKEGETERVLEAARQMVQVCIDSGGTLSGEHGIGSEKSEWMTMVYSDADLEAMKKVRAVFNPDELCNPGKILPLRHCGYL